VTVADDTAADREHLLGGARRLIAGYDSEQADWNFYRALLSRVIVRLDAIELH